MKKIKLFPIGTRVIDIESKDHGTVINHHRTKLVVQFDCWLNGPTFTPGVVSTRNMADVKKAR